MFNICWAVMFPLILSSTFSPFIIAETIVGEGDGIGVGIGVGEEVGADVGVAVGDGVGEGVGVGVGVCVGDGVGVGVGDGVGDEIGANVATIVCAAWTLVKVKELIAPTELPFIVTSTV